MKEKKEANKNSSVEQDDQGKLIEKNGRNRRRIGTEVKKIEIGQRGTREGGIEEGRKCRKKCASRRNS